MKPDEIRELRDKLRLTQAEFAARIGVSSITISRWERGVNRPVLLGLLGLVKAKRQLEINCHYLSD